jgi:membrane protease YdiL (CAAX protease family)
LRAVTLFGLQAGYWYAFIIYWLLLAGITLYLVDLKNIFKLYRNPVKSPIGWILAAFLPAVATFFVSFLPSFFQLTFPLMLLTIFSAMFNGFLEELFWRGLTIDSEVLNRKLVAVASCTGFFLWHFSLAYLPGIEFEGGPIALLGGALLMGILWQLVSLKTNSLVYNTIAHILVNIFAFSTLILQNWM